MNTLRSVLGRGVEPQHLPADPGWECSDVGHVELLVGADHHAPRVKLTSGGRGERRDENAL